MNWQRTHNPPEQEYELKVWYRPTMTDGVSVYTLKRDSAKEVDHLARIYAGLVTTERVVVYMPDGTTRVYLGPNQARDSQLIRLPLAVIGGR